MAGVGTTGFVLSLSWLSSVTAGHTKRVTVNAVMLIAYCIGNAAAPFMWQAKYQPRCVSRSSSPPAWYFCYRLRSSSRTTGHRATIRSAPSPSPSPSPKSMTPPSEQTERPY